MADLELVRFVMPLADGRHVEASAFFVEGSVRLVGALIDRDNTILQASPRRVLRYDPETFAADLEFFAAEFEAIIGLELPGALLLFPDDGRSAARAP
jgi:hypothetical protein